MKQALVMFLQIDDQSLIERRRTDSKDELPPLHICKSETIENFAPMQHWGCFYASAIQSSYRVAAAEVGGCRRILRSLTKAWEACSSNLDEEY